MSPVLRLRACRLDCHRLRCMHSECNPAEPGDHDLVPVAVVSWGRWRGDRGREFVGSAQGRELELLLRAEDLPHSGLELGANDPPSRELIEEWAAHELIAAFKLERSSDPELGVAWEGWLSTHTRWFTARLLEAKVGWRLEILCLHDRPGTTT